ncbi:stimulator of interferon genes protein homolog isoform X2 [Drosophila gunungcola]|uniref:stimulator of interferon genes protein homolog isoform X2 n=1 Tax=Drosophila gunungcola TaxID=103775 RepID=UPI0022E2DBA3|nr:stimulator of interferon genes protein homolog isoform X2 [Drosophila gunungcola]
MIRTLTISMRFVAVTSVHIVETVFLADILQRLFLSVVEYVRHKPNYLPEDRVRRILRRSFTYRNKSKCLLWCVFLGMVISVTGNLRAVFPSFKFLVHIPLYWLLKYVEQSPLTDLYWLRDSHGLDYATGMALNWFHGRLKASLPERQDDGLKPRMDVYEAKDNVSFGLNQLVILSLDESSNHEILKKHFICKARHTMTRVIQLILPIGSSLTWEKKKPKTLDVFRLTLKSNDADLRNSNSLSNNQLKSWPF